MGARPDWFAVRPDIRLHRAAGHPGGDQRTRLQWTPWEELNAGFPLDPRGAVTVQVLEERSDEERAEHTTLLATASDGVVWTTYWRTKDESRLLPRTEPSPHRRVSRWVVSRSGSVAM